MAMRTRFFPELFDDDDVLHAVGSAKHQSFGNDLNVLIWNIYKGRNKTWQDDFLNLVEDRNLVLLQESVINTRHDAMFGSPERFEWIMAKGHQIRRTKAVTGVKTGATVISANRSYYRSLDVEPILRTPKMLLATTYPVAGQEHPLLCVNIHAINFVGFQKFSRQIDQMIKAVESHAGPVILAGDFNTWNALRYKNLRDVTDKMGLTEVPLQRKGRWQHLNQHLDHIFYRGMILKNADVLFNIRTSDHYPIRAEFSFS